MDDCSCCHAPIDHRFIDCLGDFSANRGQANMVARESNKRAVFNPFGGAVFGASRGDNHSVARVKICGARGSFSNRDFGDKQHRRYFAIARHRTWRSDSCWLHGAYDYCCNRWSPTLGCIWVLKPSRFQLARVCTVELWQKKTLKPKRPAQIFLEQKF